MVRKFTDPSELIITSPRRIQQFWERVQKTDACWTWTAGKFRDGYGQFKMNGTPRAAHRVAYANFVAPIPAGMLIDHICFNRACVRPEHLRVVTEKQNQEHRQGPMRRSTTKIRGVCFNKAAGKWQADVGHHGRVIYCGLYETPEDAERVVIAARAALFTHDDAPNRSSWKTT